MFNTPKAGFRSRYMAAALLLAAMAMAGASPAPARAEVRFGKNVRIGGHDFSDQTYNRQRRAEIRLYDHNPRNPGCVWRADGRGGKVKLCHIRRIR